MLCTQKHNNYQPDCHNGVEIEIFMLLQYLESHFSPILNVELCRSHFCNLVFHEQSLRVPGRDSLSLKTILADKKHELIFILLPSGPQSRCWRCGRRGKTRVPGASCRKMFKPTANMAAAVMMGTWRCPNRGGFCQCVLLFIVLLSNFNAVVAVPETGLWSITVVNVSICGE